MIFKTIILAASMLPWGTNVSTQSSVATVESSTVMTPVAMQNQSIPHQILTILIEDHATKLFGLSTEDAWSAYSEGDLIIIEIDENAYSLEYDGILEIALIDNQN